MLVAFLLTLVAGGATSIGAALGVLGRGTGPRFLAGGLGLLAGVMRYVYFGELLPEGARVLTRGAAPPGRGRIGSTSGGTGIALSRRAHPSPALLAHLAWLMGEEAQRVALQGDSAALAQLEELIAEGHD